MYNPLPLTFSYRHYSKVPFLLKINYKNLREFYAKIKYKPAITSLQYVDRSEHSTQPCQMVGSIV
jgi:hypothetical protein